MDRVNGTDWVDIGGGRRGFRSQNAAAGIAGTEVTDVFLNSVQEELSSVIEQTGAELDPADNQQLSRAVQSGRLTYATSAGSAANLTAAITPSPLSLQAGLSILLKAGDPNTGPVTLNLNALGEKPIVYDETGLPLEGGDFGAEALLPLRFDGTNWRLRSALGFFDRRYNKLTVPTATVFYVIGPIGNDNNSGFAATADKGFATVQGAINAISSRYIVPGIVTIRISAGTYAGFNVPTSFISAWDIIGNTANPAQVKINSLTAAVNNGRGIRNGGATITLSGIEISSYYENVSNIGGNLTLKDLNINMPLTTDRGAVASYGGRINVYGNIKVSGNGSTFLDATQNGTIQLGYADAAVSNPTAINFNGASFSSATMSSNSGGSLLAAPSVLTMTGSATGKRYNVYSNGTINTYGGGANFFPGTTAGTASSGGQYL
ncbi:MAG: hypothetical protein IH622_06075 [Ochrobactrum anthropi]|uniref:Uncharacterized protein n=1 Tax=Brucella anthropi TaxID=529 RepID=A0A8I0N486_BRUAN|nr:hypothetical protein [Brucella anthropi]MBE0560378.1 hypothetical protein [Brucella anthropi]